ncbi:hypothetical protein [Mesorhizobium sp.]|uniref:hypothetical protein n=1 Tax=Mesorhizobium sp. TaxID=1871066 RepID=UPI0012009878|nr:hypothetical protein [Mesorhizobium sp.]TIX28860.1 MAG: hypothetical protein E5V35_00430 [Mesorhizobium sp.]
MTKLYSLGPYLVDYAGGYGMVGIYDPSRVLLGTAHQVGDDELRIDRAEANANLFAASFEMLAALKELRRIVADAREDENVDAMTDAGGYLCGDVMSEAVEAADAAIAKAEG